MFEQKVAGLLSKVKELGLNNQEILEKLEKPPQHELGDLAFPCFFLAPKLKKNPAEIAKGIANALNKKLPKEIERVEAINGYVNFFLSNSLISDAVLHEILKGKENYGSSNLGKGMKVLLEHTSINPNASPHVGRARGALIGDCLARLLKFQGYDVKVHYYVNDVSKQVALLVLSCKGNEKFEKILDLYVRAAKKLKNRKFEQKVFDVLRKFEMHDKETAGKFKNIVKKCVEGQLKILSRLDINYDIFDYESDYMSELSNLLIKFEETGKLSRDKESRFVLNQSGTGLENEMREPVLVLTRSDGTALYVLRDIAYTIDKLKKAERNIIILGEDQKLYFKQLANALSLLDHKAPRVLHYSFVLVSTSKGKKKMSTRKGELVLLEDFMNEAVKKAALEIRKRKTKGDAEAIGMAAVKYAILKTEENKNVVFSWQEALNFEGDTGPYLQYAYARASSILRKAKLSKKQNKADFSILKNEKEISLIKMLSEFPEICKNTAGHLTPHVIAGYAYKLAKSFNDFYESCPVLNAGQNEKEARLLLVVAARQVLGNALALLGINALERM